MSNIIFSEIKEQNEFTRWVIEWIPHNKLDIYLTKGGFAKIYTAIWIGGRYKVWNSKEQELERSGSDIKVILKRLENVENATRHWFEEAKTHLDISNKYAEIVRCFGLTQDPLNRDYMLVMKIMDIDLRKYLQQNHNQLTWKERISIIHNIIHNLNKIHEENIFHRDLHSGNILHSPRKDNWRIGDLGFCGPVDKPLKSIYGNLPYIAPEVIYGKQTTKASDIYSIAMLMWEISSGQPPFFNHEHDYNLAMNIINGIRPKVVSGTPPEYKNLMGMSNELFHPVITNNIEMKESDFTDAYSKLFTSKVHQFENFPEPRMQPKVKVQELKDFTVNHMIFIFLIIVVEDFVKSSNKKNNNTSKISNIFKGNLYQNNNSNKQLLIYDFNLSVSSKKLSKIFKTSSRNGIQNNYIKEEKMQRQITKHHIDDDDICNNPNFHSVKQNELEISDEFKTNVK
ncbi:hypothetical protein RclHR1_08480005 [Rhizophagus clarus]|uniref:Protein kinase domain-containing protein n=1 Tax=Rhizophagus clarus TaxID=94130 RepID=A0A2Z6SG13_9GLOM|nr:hypothetical protein RclHR1_08480005 [Rhizophagus clarus]